MVKIMSNVGTLAHVGPRPPVTLGRLMELVSGHGPRDFRGWAEEVYRVDPALGQMQRLHAQAADGNSPDLCQWPRHAWDEHQALAAAGITTAEAAAAEWMRLYS